MSHVFISYVRENQKEVDRLCEELSKHGVKVWLARNDIRAGARWQDAIDDAIQKVAHFIACFSKEYNQRGETYMNEELTQAIDRLRKLSTDCIWFIPVKLNECEIPKRRISDVYGLTNLQCVELYRHWDVGIQRILDVIRPIPLPVQDLLKALRSGNKAVSKAAVKALRKAFENIGSRTVPGFVEVLEGGDEEGRAFAAWALGEIRDASAVPALIKALGDDNIKVCMKADVALRKIGKSVTTELIHALGDESNTRRVFFAARALRKMGKSPKNMLIQALDDQNGRVRMKVAEILSEIEAPSTVPMLIRGLNNKDHEFRGRAATAVALGKMGRVAEPAVPALVDALGDEDDEVRAKAAEALGNIGDGSAIPALLKTLGDVSWSVRISAVIALGEIGEFNISIVNAVIETLCDENERVRKSAAWTLGEVGDASAVSALIQALDDEDNEVRRNAAEALGKIGDASAVPALIKALDEEDKDDKVCVKAVEALGKIGDVSAVPALVEAFKVWWGDEVGEQAAIVLGEIGDASAVPVLVEALYDYYMSGPHRSTRAWFRVGSVRNALIKIGEPVVSELTDILEERDWMGSDYSESVASILQGIGTSAACEAIRRYEELKEWMEQEQKERDADLRW